MRKLATMGASALVLVLGIAGAAAQPSTDQLLNAGLGATFQSSAGVQSNATILEGRAAAAAPFANYQLQNHGR